MNKKSIIIPGFNEEAVWPELFGRLGAVASALDSARQCGYRNSGKIIMSAA
jgi:hypothetical protein